MNSLELLILWQLSHLILVEIFCQVKDILKPNNIVLILQMVAFPIDSSTNLPIIPPNSSLSFRLPNALFLYRTKRLYFDSIWANNRNPSLPAIMIGFANYLRRKNLQNKLAEPILRPQSLDAYLEFKHTVEILTHQVQKLEQQQRNWKNKERSREQDVKRTMGRISQETVEDK